LRRAFAAEEVDLKAEVTSLMELFDIEEGDRRKLAESDASVSVCESPFLNYQNCTLSRILLVILFVRCLLAFFPHTPRNRPHSQAPVICNKSEEVICNKSI